MAEQTTKEGIRLSVFDDPRLHLRSAAEADLEDLRLWKNDQREYFFHKSEITPEQQRSWFTSFQDRPYDFMFMVECEDQSIGCMGIRLIDDGWDIYNVILGRQEFGRQGLMGKAFKSMLAFAVSIKDAPITLKVLKHNPAVEWYLRGGFVVTSTHDDHFYMTYQTNSIQQDPP